MTSYPPKAAKILIFSQNHYGFLTQRPKISKIPKNQKNQGEAWCDTCLSCPYYLVSRCIPLMVLGRGAPNPKPLYGTRCFVLPSLRWSGPLACSYLSRHIRSHDEPWASFIQYKHKLHAYVSFIHPIQTQVTHTLTHANATPTPLYKHTQHLSSFLFVNQKHESKQIKV